MVSAGRLVLESLNKAYGSFKAVDDVNLDVKPGSFVSLLGPSGCGKTTTLRMIAGFIQPTSGNIRVNDTVISSESEVLPPAKRNMGMVFQSYAVWPHLSVFDNIAYGLRTRKLEKSEIVRRTGEAIEIVGLTGQESKFSSQLSGGQQQRVALARAIVTEPSILLLDEPLSNLDAKLRESMRIEIRRLQRRLGITTIFVTHNQEEALLLSDTIAVMKSGRVLELSAPADLYERPRTRFVAEFVGLSNILPGKITKITGNFATFETPFGSLECLAPELDGNFPSGGGDKMLLIRPERVLVHSAPLPEQNTIKAQIKEVLYNGNIIDYIAAINGTDLSIRIQKFAPQIHREADTVFLELPREAVTMVQ